MPLVAFRVDWFGEIESWHGAYVWSMSAIMLFQSGFPLSLVMFVTAMLNIPQLIWPFLSNDKLGTSKLWVWSFAITAVVFVPMLVIIVILNERRDGSLREGYFVYQAGYIISAIGLYLKRRRACGGTDVRASGDQVMEEINSLRK